MVGSVYIANRRDSTRYRVATATDSACLNRIPFPKLIIVANR